MSPLVFLSGRFWRILHCAFLKCRKNLLMSHLAGGFFLSEILNYKFNFSNTYWKIQIFCLDASVLVRGWCQQFLIDLHKSVYISCYYLWNICCSWHALSSECWLCMPFLFSVFIFYQPYERVTNSASLSKETEKLAILCFLLSWLPLFDICFYITNI